MATATRSTRNVTKAIIVAEETFTLELSRDEATFLAAVLNNVGGDPERTARRHHMRRSDIKQLRRRLTCSALRVWQQYTDVEKNLNKVFMATQRFEVAISEGKTTEFDFKALLVELRAEAKTLSDLATWYKSGHEQLNSMIAFAEQTIKEMSQ